MMFEDGGNAEDDQRSRHLSGEALAKTDARHHGTPIHRGDPACSAVASERRRKAVACSVPDVVTSGAG